MTERGSVRFGGTTIDYRVRRSNRRKKTVHITVDGTGVRVAAPQDTPEDDVRAIVRRRAPWILAHAPGPLLESPPKRFVSGETLPYLGRNVRMVVSPGDVRSPEVRFDHWRLMITVPRDIPEERRSESIRRAIVVWYRRRAEVADQGQRCPVVAPVRWPHPVPGPHPGPAAEVGELRARRYVEIQLAGGDAEARPGGVRGRSRTRSSEGQASLPRVLGIAVPVHARRPAAPPAPA